MPQQIIHTRTRELNLTIKSPLIPEIYRKNQWEKHGKIKTFKWNKCKNIASFLFNVESGMHEQIFFIYKFGVLFD